MNTRADRYQSRVAPNRFVGGIRRASQGVFEILPRAPGPGVMQEGQIQKTLRVVATIEYALR